VFGQHLDGDHDKALRRSHAARHFTADFLGSKMLVSSHA
jgi:hypothetical protein